MGEKKVKELWNIDDLSDFLGMPRSTTYVLVSSGKIPSLKIGKHRRFIPDEVKAALKKFQK